MSYVVSKFGGSSVRDAEAIKRCAKIIESDDNQRVIVVSATYNTTNQLEHLARLSLDSLVEGLQFWGTILERHFQIARDLNIEDKVQNHFEALDIEAQELVDLINKDTEIDEKTMDQVYSLGERLSSCLVASFIDGVYFDAREVIKTNHDYGQALPLIKESSEKAKTNLINLVNGPKRVVTQGFIGSTLDGITTTLGREGSDFSAALFGEAIGAGRVNIWTDVPGIATCDPKLVKDVRFMNELSYDQATLLAELGAKVLFPRTLEPAKRSKMNVFVGSSIESKATGTLITSKLCEEQKVLGLTCFEKDGKELVSLVGHKLLEIQNFSPEKELEKEKISFAIERHDSDVFSVLVEGNQKNKALNVLHNYLMTF